MKNRKYTMVFAYLRELPYVSKEDLAHEWSDGRTTSLRELSDKEYNRLISHIRSHSSYRAKLRKARSGVLHLLQKYGIDTTDWQRINSFCKQKKIAGKPFGELSVSELGVLANKMRAIIEKVKQRDKAIKEELRQRYGSNITVVTTYKTCLVGEA